ncbi:MAG TPA: trypsin-like peptidase domain-containing protein [Planctomycetota bacterium]|nr:trypsin-like peptidase domain-containing protein [Planctomycetota bacterium]
MTTYQNYPPSRRPSAMPLVLAGAAFALAIFAVLDRSGYFAPAPKTEPRVITPRGKLSEYERDLIAVRQKVSPSVAQISSSEILRGWRGAQEVPIGTGSGFVWDQSGTVITNFHVVRDPESPPQDPRVVDHVKVFVAGREYEADVDMKHVSPQHDLAVLRLRGNAADLQPIELGTSKDLQIGQTAIAIGAPFGFDQSMTTGIVSALNRTIETKEGNLIYGLIQVDTAINPGNSGGPLLDSAGRLIGVNTAIYSPSGASAGIGFAVPVDLVNEIVPHLIAGRNVQTVLGVRSEYEAIQLPATTGYASGALVTKVESGFGAALAGLRPSEVRDTNRGSVVQKYGDVIVAIDGQPVRGFSDIRRTIQGHVPGEHVKVKVVRGLPEKPQLVDLEVNLSAMTEGLTTGM